MVQDLKERGLLDDTLVVWATEFGRSPGVEVRPNDATSKGGRDHHPFGFTTWRAGGGIKGGLIHGATDELGFHAVENRHYVTDIHATALNQLGQDPLSGHLFLFSNRMHTRLKALVWDGSGLWVCAKRLEKGRFRWPEAKEKQRSVTMRAEELAMLVNGLDLKQTRQRNWYRKSA